MDEPYLAVITDCEFASFKPERRELAGLAELFKYCKGKNRSTWYQTLEDEDAIHTAVSWVLGDPEVFLITAGDIHIPTRTPTHRQRGGADAAEPGDADNLPGHRIHLVEGTLFVGYNQLSMIMNDEERSQVKRWVLGWHNAEPVLKQIKKSELQRIDTAAAIQRLARAFESCRIHFKPSNHSGLVEQQRWFQKLRQ